MGLCLVIFRVLLATMAQILFRRIVDASRAMVSQRAVRIQVIHHLVVPPIFHRVNVPASRIHATTPFNRRFRLPFIRRAMFIRVDDHCEVKVSSIFRVALTSYVSRVNDPLFIANARLTFNRRVVSLNRASRECIQVTFPLRLFLDQAQATFHRACPKIFFYHHGHQEWQDRVQVGQVFSCLNGVDSLISGHSRLSNVLTHAYTGPFQVRQVRRFARGGRATVFTVTFVCVELLASVLVVRLHVHSARLV